MNIYPHIADESINLNHRVFNLCTGMSPRFFNSRVDVGSRSNITLNEGAEESVEIYAAHDILVYKNKTSNILTPFSRAQICNIHRSFLKNSVATILEGMSTMV